MRFVFVMDPLDRVSPEKDTTYAFIEAAQRRGHASFHCLPRDLFLARGDLHATCHRVEITKGPPHIELRRDEGISRLALGEVDAVFVRKDPPFDQAYLYATLLLEHVRGRTLLVNDPRGLRDANEKLYALNFPDWTPPTLVTADRDLIYDFVAEVGGRAVIKPLDGAGGMGVMLLKRGDMNERAISDMLTLEGTRLAIVQQFLPEVTEGDKRVLLLDGEPLGAILRVARGDELRSNIHVGGNVVPTELSEHEIALARSIAPRLRADGLVFVGLDVIGGRLTEVNVTSPTGIQELGRFTETQPSDRVIEWVERHAVGAAS